MTETYPARGLGGGAVGYRYAFSVPLGG